MVFDKNKIQIKHIIEMEKDIEGWPSPDDILYFVCRRAHDKEKEGDITFSDYIIQKKMESASADIIQSSLQKLVKRGYIKKIKESESKATYQILVNPYEKTNSAKDPQRKPNPGMALQVKREHDIDLSKSIMVGDKDDDKNFSNNAGMSKFYWIKDFKNLEENEL